jgi:hypothetical protein
MAQQKFDIFFRRVGIRDRAHLARPRLFPFGEFAFPFESIYHFNQSNVHNGPTRNDPVLQSVAGRVFIEHVTELSATEGNPRKTSINVRMLENDFRRRSRGLRPLRRDEALAINPRNLLVVNYAMLYPTYRYTVSFKAEYYRWVNIASTFWQRVADLHQRFRWHQFVEVGVPERVPGYEDFLRISNGITAKSLDAFAEPGALDLVDLWQWMGESREASNLAKVKDPSLVNLIFRVRGHFCLMNLGLIDQWRKAPEGELALEGFGLEEWEEVGQEIASLESVQSDILAPTQLQRLFLALLRRLGKVQSGEEGVADPEEEAPVERAQEAPKRITVDQGDDDPEGATSSSGTVGEVSSKKEDDVLSLPPLDDALKFPDFDQEPEPPAEPDPKSVTYRPERVTPPREERPVVESDDTEGDYSTALKAYADQQLEAGLITAGAHKRILAEAEHYKTLPNPYGDEGTLGESLEITQEDLSLEDRETFPDRDTIIDKSMLKSSPREMTRKYVEKTLKKDVMNAVLAATQHQQVVIKRYNVEVVHDNMNHFEVHTLTLKPIHGRQSTVRFRLPVVDKDGRFMANGQRNRLRFQRAD